MGGNTLTDAYEVAIKVKNTLIQGGKLSPRPPMPLFLDMPTQQPVVAPTPTISTSQPSVVVPIASTSCSETNKLEAMMQTMMQGLNKKL